VKTPAPPVLILKGEPRELGRQQGAALRSQIDANIAVLLGDFITGAKSAQMDKISAW